MIEAPILAYFMLKLKTFIKTNYLNYVSIEIFLQRKKNDLIRFVTYFLKALFPAKCNYEINVKELLIIITCFKQ